MTLLIDAIGPARDDDEAMHNFYVALQPPSEAARALCALAQRRDRHPVRPENMHISLFSLGRHRTFPQGPIAQAARAICAVRHPPFTVTLDRIATWGRGRGPLPVVAWSDDGVGGVHSLHEVLCRALAATAQWRRRRPSIEPHLTVWRDSARVPLAFIAPIRWQAREVVLIDGRYGEGRHEVVDRFPLVG